MGAENLCHLAGRSADRWPLGHASGTCQIGLGLPGKPRDDLRLVGLKLIFLVVSRAVSLLACRGGSGGGRTREALARRSGKVFDLIRNGQVTPRIGQRYALADAAKAHADIESRGTTGKLLLLP